jgi:Fur family ferric uptake transcriptional regulator
MTSRSAHGSPASAPRAPTARPPHAQPSAVSSAASALAAYIEEKGLKRSRQRDRIAQVFFATPGHVTVEELVARVRREDPRISVATVYRTMKLLSECGLAAGRQFGDGQTRYEPAGQREHHDHLICTACGTIVEFANERIETLQASVARSHGFEVESHKLELYGRCERCRATTGAPGTPGDAHR